MNSEPLRQTVFVIDDDAAVRESIAALVDIRGYPVETFATAEEFLERYQQDLPGCVVTDLRIENGMTGIELRVALTDRGCTIPVIVISAYANVSNAVQAMHQGAVTLLEKNCSSEELWTAITEALHRDEEKNNRRVRVSELYQRFSEMTPDEIQVLVRIIKGHLNKVIAHDLSISLRTVETRRHNLLAKTGVGSIPELVRAYVELEQTLGRPPEDVLLERTESNS